MLYASAIVPVLMGYRKQYGNMTLAGQGTNYDGEMGNGDLENGDLGNGKVGKQRIGATRHSLPSVKHAQCPTTKARVDRQFNGLCQLSLRTMAFSSLAKILEECSIIHSPPALFFFFKVEISSRTLIPLFRPRSVRSGSAS